MSNNMQLFMRLNWDGGRVATGLSQASAQVKRFTSGAARDFDGLRKHAHEFSAAIGGVSDITRLVGTYLGLQAAKSTAAKNMEFEKSLIETKQLAQMTTEQAETLRRKILEVSGTALTGPLGLAVGEQQMANAGVKFQDLIDSMHEGARAAAVFRSEFKDTMNMDTDLMQKAGIAARDLKAVHNILYVASKGGRFEAKSLSQFAPVYLSELKQWGITGVRGVNFGGALLQSLQKIVPATEPGEVVTLLKQGLSHLAQPHVLKNLQKYFGIDPRKFAPGGKFRSVDDILALAGAMKAKGMTDPFKVGKVFREEYARKFWLQLMADTEEIRKSMQENERAMAEDEVGKDYAEIQRSNYAKAVHAQNAVEKAQAGSAASAVTTAYANILEFATQHPLQAGAGALGLFMGGRMLWNRAKNGKAGGSGAAGALGEVAGMAGVQRVFVVNMPGGGMGAGPLALPPGEGWSAEKGAADAAAAAKAARWGGAVGAAKGVLKWGALPALAFAGYDAWQTARNNQLNEEAKKTEYGRIAGGAAGGLGGAAIGAGIGAWFAGVGAIPGALIGGALGNALGERAGKAGAQKIILQSHLHVDGRELARQVQEFIHDDYLRN